MSAEEPQREKIFHNWKSRVISAVHAFDDLIVAVLMGMIVLVILLSTFELGWMILEDITSPPFVLLRIRELLDIFGLFLIVLIGVELLTSLKTYFVEQKLHVEVVLQVALISVARRVIVFEIDQPSNLTLIALAILLLALAGAYYFQVSQRMKLPAASDSSRS